MNDTPMMQQYKTIKGQYPGYLLFYRMGDFYEMFGDDALQAAETLQITLTQRRTSKDAEGIPMCGVPYHAAEGYIAKLINRGFKVALCEQTESPEEAKKRGGAKALVTRDVVRLYTGGTLTEDNLLPSDASRWLATLAEHQGTYALAWLDMAAGSFGVTSVTPQTLAAELAALNPAEILVPCSLADTFATDLYGWPVTVEDVFFASSQTDSALVQAFDEGPSFSENVQRIAAGAAVAYAQHTQVGKLPALQMPETQVLQTKLILDEATRRHLELTETLQGEKKGSLLHAIDRTATAAGARLLRNWVSQPLADTKAINQRLESIATFLDSAKLRADVRDTLKQCTDVGRALSRIVLERGSPRDVHSLRQTLKQLPDLQKTVENVAVPLIQQQTGKLSGFDQLSHLLDAALKEEDLPMLARDGGFIRTGYDAELDSYRDLQSNGLQKLKELEQAEQARTGIPTLKLKYNKVWGYFLEVSKGNVDKVPEDYIHRQTTTNAQRFSTAELMTLEREFSAAETNSLAREQQVFAGLIAAVQQKAGDLLELAEALATLDVLAAGAELAEQRDYVQPVVDDSYAFDIVGGRHPVVENTVENFVANNCALTDGELWLLTGPNMAGKSTFLRQNALITLLAQMGYFVPATQAHIGLVDRIFTRIGAADDLSRGQSTFMVEMVETASILNNSTNRSLVVLDEIGRGTATYDGMSIAWACVEHLAATIGCRGLFATHYHELTVLADQLENVHIHHVTVKEWQGDIVFLHAVQAGAAPRSYGVHVGRLAGLPQPVLKRAEEILSGLEKSAQGKPVAAAEDLPLFTTPVQSSVTSDLEQTDEQAQQVKDKLLEIDLDTLSPREAQNLLYDLRILAAIG
ncbi:MAG: DNA mismatch repair protein MutS [Alphaproteobacteria bacterium]|nr:DNA mismatch repair protein MutS [Alphaproteobacteria bacterium]MDD9920300.1 DNA mismatch repair protein MutS [Alphaproteobacteria bacterium]